MFAILYPVPLLMLASVGLGDIVCLSLQRRLPALSPASLWPTAYFFGQGLLGTILLFMAVAGWFTPLAVGALLWAGGLAGVACLWLQRASWLTAIGEAWRVWLRASLLWKLLACAVLLLALLGVSTLGGGVDGDAIAFYLVVPKLTAYSHRLELLPSYESFMVVGLLAEMLIAALFSLGMPNVSPGIFTWANFLPALLMFYALARHCGLGRRGATLALTVPLTSSAVLLLWGGGKTDLVAVGPALAALLFALLSWEREKRRVSLALAGVLFGFSAVFKLTYLLPFLPGLILVIYWQELAAFWQAGRTHSWGELGRLMRRAIGDGIIFMAAFTCAFAPHIIKNLMMLGKILGDNPLNVSWYSPATVLRLLLSYPLALTYGRYWAQFGNLSPLVLAFAPLLFFLPHSASWRESRLTAVTTSALIGVGLWMAFEPSIFMPRYFLATLLLLGIPTAAGAACYSRKGVFPTLAVVVTALTTLAVTPLHMLLRGKSLDLANPQRYLLDPKGVFAAYPLGNYYQAHAAINAVAPKNARIAMLTYYRFWLRPDLIQNIVTGSEFTDLSAGPDVFWAKAQEEKISFLLVDTSLFHVGNAILAAKPHDITLRELFKNGTLAAYEIRYDAL